MLLLPLVGVSGTFCVASVPHLNPLPGCTFRACRHKTSCPLCCFSTGSHQRPPPLKAGGGLEPCSHAELGDRWGRRVPPATRGHHVLPGAQLVPGAAPGLPSAPEPCLSSAVDAGCVVSPRTSSSWWLTRAGTAASGDRRLLMPEVFSGD